MMPRWASHCDRGIGCQSCRAGFDRIGILSHGELARICRNSIAVRNVRNRGETCLADSWRLGYNALSDHGSGACSYQPLQAAEPSESQGRDATAREHEFAGNAISGRTGAPQFSHRHFYLPLAAGFAQKKVSGTRQHLLRLESSRHLFLAKPCRPLGKGQ